VIGNRRVLAVIAARGGSKGLPGKNLLPLSGLPLIGWTIRAAKASRLIDRLILSSDDQEIIRVAQGLGCEAPFVRSSALATDTATSLDVVLDAVDRIPGYDVVVLLQPTSPLRTAGDIDGTVSLLESQKSAVSVTEALAHPWLVYGNDDAGLLTPFVQVQDGVSLRRQDLPMAWALNGAVYAADVDWLKGSHGFVRGGQTGFWPMSAETSIDIDTEQDFDLAGQMLAMPRS
jgi:CMP-N,N'-diacetyllegionaminic acid synthase